jgi:hypothetical protein
MKIDKAAAKHFSLPRAVNRLNRTDASIVIERDLAAGSPFCLSHKPTPFRPTVAYLQAERI